MKGVFRFAVFATLLAASLSQAEAEERTYKSVNVDVPFKFNVGQRSFHPGYYQFLFVGTNLMAVRDAHAHIVASLVIRYVETGTPAPATKLVFHPEKKHLYLAQIKIRDQSRILEIVGEELAIYPSTPPTPAPPEIFSFNDRRMGPRIRQ